MRFFAALGVLVVAAGPALGAETSFRAGGTTLYLALGDPDAFCRVETGDDSTVVEARCSVGAFFVVATPETGCGDSFGPAYCASVDPGDNPPVANELRCANGVAYVLMAGLGDVRCTQAGDSKRCESAGGRDAAEATCGGGCGSTLGAGVCCIAGAEGCPPKAKSVD